MPRRPCLLKSRSAPPSERPQFHCQTTGSYRKAGAAFTSSLNETTSSFPSTSTANKVLVSFPVLPYIGGENVPSPAPRKIVRKLKPPEAKSVIPSPLKSPVASDAASKSDATDCCSWKVPSPLPVKYHQLTRLGVDRQIEIAITIKFTYSGR